VNFDGKTVYGLSGSDIRRATLFMRLAGDTIVLYDKEAGVAATGIRDGIKSYVQMVRERGPIVSPNIGAFQVQKETEAAAIAELGIFKNPEAFDGFLGLASRPPTLEKFFKGPILTHNEVVLACKNFDGACATIFERDLRLLVAFIPVIEAQSAAKTVSAEFTVRRIDDMLATFWPIMMAKRYGADITELVDMSDRGTWEKDWTFAKDAFPITEVAVRSCGPRNVRAKE
jgi:hypothetical protein